MPVARKSPSGRAERGRRPKAKKKPQKRAKQKEREEKARAFARGLGDKERVALAVRDELYDGSWERMREDLDSRREGRTYVFRLASRIEEDLRTIRKLSAFERRHDVDLSKYVRQE